MDKTLLSSPFINIHPLRNDRTTTLSPADLNTFVIATNHTITPLDFASAPPPPAAPSSSSSGANGAKKEAKEKKKEKVPQDEGVTKLGVAATKSGDFGAWYTQTLTLSEMIDYSDISGG
jgi:hypothetical protein